MRVTTPPLISVVIPTYNGAAFIRDTLDSVRAQSVPDFEIVVVDDGSADDTVAIAEGCGDRRVRVFRTPANGGPARARTLGVAHVRGAFVAGLDQDDLCRPDRFARQLAFLQDHPEVALVTSAIEGFGSNTGVTADPYPNLADPAEIDWTLQLLNPLAWSSVLMRGEAARALDPFERDERRYAEDFDLYHRVRRFGRIGRITAPLVRYRQHATGMSQTGEARMIHAAGLVLADAYAGLFDGGEAAAGQLMSRLAGASHAPADAAELAEYGRVLAVLLAARGALAPGFAPASAAAHWWRIARAGLRAGRYPAAALGTARPAFAGAAPPLARDRAVGAVRRLLRRAV